MSWQDKERERYEKKLAERWTREGLTKDIKAYEITSSKLSKLMCDRCGQDIKMGDSWERDIHQTPFDPHGSMYGANEIFGGFARHIGDCPTVKEQD